MALLPNLQPLGHEKCDRSTRLCSGKHSVRIRLNLSYVDAPKQERRIRRDV